MAPALPVAAVSCTTTTCVLALCACALLWLQVAVDGLEPTYSVLRSPLLPDVADQDAAPEGPTLLPCRLWGNSDRDGDVSGDHDRPVHTSVLTVVSVWHVLAVKLCSFCLRQAG
jgi:hypothetical protein